MTHTRDGDARVFRLTRKERSRPTVPHADAVAFGVELPARGDIVFAVAALTQLLTIAEQAGVDSAGDLTRTISALRRRLRAHDIGLSPELEEMIEQLTAPRLNAGDDSGDIHVLPLERR